MLLTASKNIDSTRASRAAKCRRKSSMEILVANCDKTTQIKPIREQIKETLQEQRLKSDFTR